MRLHPASIAVVMALVPPAAAQAPPPAAPLAAQDPLAAAFDALAEADRKTIQDALVWTGDYQGVIDGVFGRRSREAFFAFDRKRDPAADGAPTPPKLKALQAAAARARQAAGFAMTNDPTGARIGVPKAILPQASRAGAASRYASRDGRIALDLAVVDGAEMDLPRLFERLRAESPARRVTYKLARPDFVVVAGETPGRKFYTRFAQGADTQGRPVLRGFTFYTPDDRPDLERVVIAVANSFDPFPGAVPEPVARPPVGQGGQVATAPGAPPAAQPATAAAAPAATAISLGAGKWLAALPTDCASATLADAPAKIVSRGKDGLALLEAAARPAVRLAAAAPAQGGQAQTQALALGFAAGQGAPGLLVASGRLDAAGALVAGLQPGMSGAPVFDREGRLLGLARPFAAPRPVAGVAPAAPHGLIAAQEAMAFAGLPAGDPAPGGAAALARAHRAALAPLTCSR
jgi:peptidoglycan hydrolase-like protein with peptidoglycan-binding domain